MATRLSQSTIRLDKPPAILEHASIVGKKEGDGPLGQEFDAVNEDTTFGEKPGRNPRAACSPTRSTCCSINPEPPPRTSTSCSRAIC